MQEFFSNMISGIGINDVIDVAIVAFILYKVLEFIRDSRAEQLVQGLLVLIAVAILSDVLKLYTLNWLLKGGMTVGLIALVIVFQPELRRGLEYVGRNQIIKNALNLVSDEDAQSIIKEFLGVIEYLASTRTGALIVIERQTALSDIAESGTYINADITKEIIGNLFYEGAPLHDGAVIIRGDKILAAGCVLPLTQNKDLPKELGTRHRAGIGITEHSDCLTILVSEETGVISVATDGKLERYLDLKEIEKILIGLYYSTDKREYKGPFKHVASKVRRNKNVSK